MRSLYIINQLSPFQSTQELINDTLCSTLATIKAELEHTACNDCKLSDLQFQVSFEKLPPLLCLEIIPDSQCTPSQLLEFNSTLGSLSYCLRAIIYHGQYHFTSRIILCEGTVCYYDSQDNQGHLEIELQQCNDINLTKLGDQTTSLYIYMLQC